MSICGGRKHIGERGPDVSIHGVLMCPRPKEFAKASAYVEDSDEEESTVGKMPPSYDSDDE